MPREVVRSQQLGVFACLYCVNTSSGRFPEPLERMHAWVKIPVRKTRATHSDARHCCLISNRSSRPQPAIMAKKSPKKPVKKVAAKKKSPAKRDAAYVVKSVSAARTGFRTERPSGTGRRGRFRNDRRSAPSRLARPPHTRVAFAIRNRQTLSRSQARVQGQVAQEGGVCQEEPQEAGAQEGSFRRLYFERRAWRLPRRHRADVASTARAPDGPHTGDAQ